MDEALAHHKQQTIHGIQAKTAKMRKLLDQLDKATSLLTWFALAEQLQQYTSAIAGDIHVHSGACDMEFAMLEEVD